MDKKEKLKLISGFLITVIIIIIFLNYVLRISEDNLINIIIALVVASTSILSVIFSNKTNKQIDNIKVDVNELKTEMKDIVITITEKDLEDAEKFQRHYNAIIDLDDKWDAKKSISMLGKSMQRVSKKIMNKHFDVNSELKEFLIKITESVKEYVTSEYEYGLDLLDLEDYEILIFDKVNTVASHIDLGKLKSEGFESVKCAVNNNIHKYIKDLNGIQDLRNGQRRERFEEKTIEFITNAHHQSFEAYNKMI